MYQLHDHGRNPDGELKWGKNSRLDNLQRPFLIIITKFHNMLLKKKKLQDLQSRSVLSMKLLYLVPMIANHFDIYQNYEIQADNRDQLKNF